MYGFIKFILKCIFLFFFRYEVEGRENIPGSGPVIIASNHISLWDPPVIASAIARPVHFMAKEELFKNPIFAWIITKLNAFPVKRGAADRTAIRTAIRILEEGKTLGLFPEGTRSKTGKLGRPEPGLAMIAVKTGSTIIPTAVIGTNKAFRNGCFFPKFKVKFGKPIEIEKGKNDKETITEVSDKLMSEIANLLSQGK